MAAIRGMYYLTNIPRFIRFIEWLDYRSM